MKRVMALVMIVLAACADSEGPDESSTAAALIEPGHGARTGSTIALGNSHACAITKWAAVVCWGANSYGQLGDGTTIQRNTPVVVPGLNNVVSIAAGGFHTCAALANGTVRCWGRNSSGQLGDNSTNNRTSPVVAAGLSEVKQLSAGLYHSCALEAHGGIKCWGLNSDGQLGNNSTTNSKIPVFVFYYSDWKQVTAGYYHTCGLRANGAVYCWGWDGFGQLGASGASSTTPIAASLMTDMRQLAAGAHHTCSLKDGGTVYCWGYNALGQLGDGTTTDRHFGVPVSSLTSVGYLAAGGLHTCAIRTMDGQARCWGFNNAAQVGTGSSTPSTILTPSGSASLILGATEIALGADSADNYQGTSCALRGIGDIVCWGFGSHGQMGNGTTTAVNPSPMTVSMPVQPRSTVSLSSKGASAPGQYSLAIGGGDGSNRAWQWAPGGAPTQTGPFFTTPRMVASAEGLRCAVLIDGTAQCWGNNSYGQVGDGTFTGRADPVDVAGLLGMKAVHIDADKDHACAVLTDGTVRCWGNNQDYTLGNGTGGYPSRSNTPVTVLGLENAAIQVSVGSRSGCALLVDGRVSCWGDGYAGGAVGSPDRPLKATASLTSPLAARAVAIAGGGGSVEYRPDGHCALLVDGRVQCWGWWPGSGTWPAAYSETPVLVDLGTDRAVAIAGAGTSKCLIISDGTVRCWGAVMMDDAGVAPNVPVPVSGLSNIIAVSTGERHACAANASGQIYCWSQHPTGAPVPTFVMTL